MIQVVDLASRFSAVVVRVEGGEVYDQFDSRDMTHVQFAARIARTAKECRLTVVEDVPYGISSQAMVKPVLRLQGILIGYQHTTLDRLLFLAPATWMSKFPGVQRAPKGYSKTEAEKYRIEQARTHAERLGYTPPDLVQQYIDSLPEGAKVLKKNTAPLEKNMTDYVSAFLMSEFVLSMPEEDFRGLQGVAPTYI